VIVALMCLRGEAEAGQGAALVPFRALGTGGRHVEDDVPGNLSAGAGGYHPTA
jgi:hypothetical protein